MLKKICGTMLFLLCCTQGLVAQSDPVTVWFPDRQWYPGDPVIAYVKAAPGTQTVTFSIWSTSSKKITFKAYPASKYEGMWVCLAALNALVEPGEFSYEIQGKISDSKQWTMKGIFLVQPKAFKSYTINIDQKTTTLVTKPDPKKTEQFHKLRSILVNFDTSLTQYEGKAVAPLQNLRVTSTYGDRRVYVYTNGTRSTSEHTGLDWGGAKGTPIKAGIKGLVVLAENRILSGNSVVICPLPGVFVMFYHMDSLTCTVGQIVDEATLIGTIGATGFVTGPHLHYEVQIQGYYTNPEILLNQGFVDTDAAFEVLWASR
jgi:hypothetical protein